MILRRWTLIPLVVLSVALAGCSSGKKSPAAAGSGGSGNGAPVSGALTIHIKNFAFDPKSPSVKVGTKVTWVNDDSATHTATAGSPTGVFDTKNLGQGKSGEFTFTTAGTFDYICSIHQYMKGSIVVVS